MVLFGCQLFLFQFQLSAAYAMDCYPADDLVFHVMMRVGGGLHIEGLQLFKLTWLHYAVLYVYVFFLRHRAE